MIFTLVSAAQEWLNNLSDETRKLNEEMEEKRLRDEEEAERVSIYFYFSICFVVDEIFIKLHYLHNAV